MSAHAKVILTLLIALLVSEGCIAPRANIQSGKVTPKGEIAVGYDLTVNVPFNTAKIASSQVLSEYKSVVNQDDTPYERDRLTEYSRLTLAQALDPIGSSNQFYVRYGAIDRLDLGLAYGSAGFIFDTALQLLHSERHALDASIGLQYSAQNFELPSIAGDAQELLGFDFNRDDLLLRVTASIPFGPSEQYGSFGFGAALNYTRLNYGFQPEDVGYDIGGDQIAYLSEVPSDAESFFAYGGFINIKVGYEYIYLVSSLNLYHQSYGTYTLPAEQTETFDGWTLVPSIGVTGRFAGPFKDTDD